MNKTIRKIISLVISVAMLTAIMTTTLTASAEENSAVTEKINSTAEYYLSLYEEEMPTYGSEWVLMGLARADKLTDEIAQGYYENIEAYVTENGSDKLHESKSTENSRVIIALSSIGKDARDVAEITDNGNTYHGFGKGESIIDYVFLSESIKCKKYERVIEKKGESIQSDHYGVLATIEL